MSSDALDVFWKVCWQAAAVAAIVGLACRGFGRAPAAWRHALWVLVVAKLFMPPLAQLPPELAFWKAGLTAATQPALTLVTPAESLSPSLQAIPHADTPVGAVSRMPPPAAPAPPFPVARLLAALWASGAAVMGILLLVRLLRQRQVVADSGPAGERAAAILSECTDRLRVRRRVEVRRCPGAGIPTLVGILRPVILLPPSVLDFCDRAQLRSILLHEIAHVRRWDVLIALFCQIARIGFYFHPALWAAVRNIRREQEQACDELVIASGAVAPREYAHGYLAVLKLAAGMPPAPVAVAMAESFEDHRKRIAMMLRPSVPRFTWKWAAALAVLGVCVLVTFKGVGAEDNPAAREKAAAAQELAQKGDYAGAADAYAELLREFPGTDAAGKATKQSCLECQILARRWPEAIALAEELRTLYPEDAALWRFKAGVCEAQRGCYIRAIAELAEGAEACGGSGQAPLLKEIRTMLAGCYQMAEQWDDLAALSEEMASKHTGEAALWRLRASLGYERKGYYWKAIESLEAGLAAANDSHDAALAKEIRGRLPQMLRLSGKIDEAEALLLRLADEDPEQAPVHLFWYAMCAKSRKDYQTAADRFQIVAARYSDQYMGKHAQMEVYGCLLMVPGRQAEAEAAFEKLWREHPDFRPEALRVQAEIQVLQTKDFGKAEQCVKAIMAQFPESSTAHAWETSGLLANIYALQSRREAAATLSVTAARARTGEAEKTHLYCKAFNLWADLGECDKAAAVFTEMTSLVQPPDEATAGLFFKLGQCYAENGRKAEARNCFDRLLTEHGGTRWADRARAELAALTKARASRNDTNDVEGATRP